jgi:hypothetical protein
MMPPLAPVITQTVTDAPVPINTIVATLAPGAGETDPGPFTYALTTDDGGAFTSTGTDVSTTADTPEGSHTIGAMVTTSGGTSPEGTVILVFVAPAPVAPEDEYAGNPQIPPPMPPGAQPVDYWRRYIADATMRLVPWARQGVDFAVGRAAKDEQMENVFWDDVVLGPRPDAEIEALARDIAAAEPR